MSEALRQRLSATRVIPALRGITVAEVPGVVESLLRFGITVLEVPLRTRDPAFSPIETEALEVLRVLRREFGNEATIVAGTVTDSGDLNTLQELGISTCLSLNLQTDLVCQAVERGINFIPGVETVTEVIAATRAGAAGLKLFPAVIREPDGGASVRITPGFVSYLSRFVSVPIIPAGNAFEDGIASAYLRSGAIALNIGAQLYQPGISLDVLQERLSELAIQLEIR